MFLRCKWLLVFWTFSMEKIFFLYTRRVGWVRLEKYGKFHTFFEGFPNAATSVATKLRRSLKLRRFLSEDPSSSSSLVHFQMLKNLRSFEDFRPKIAKIFWENLTIFWTKLSEKVQKYVLFLKL